MKPDYAVDYTDIRTKGMLDKLLSSHILTGIKIYLMGRGIEIEGRAPSTCAGFVTQLEASISKILEREMLANQSNSVDSAKYLGTRFQWRA